MRSPGLDGSGTKATPVIVLPGESSERERRRADCDLVAEDGHGHGRVEKPQLGNVETRPELARAVGNDEDLQDVPGRKGRARPSSEGEGWCEGAEPLPFGKGRLGRCVGAEAQEEERGQREGGEGASGSHRGSLLRRGRGPDVGPVRVGLVERAGIGGQGWRGASGPVKGATRDRAIPTPSSFAAGWFPRRADVGDCAVEGRRRPRPPAETRSRRSR